MTNWVRRLFGGLEVYTWHCDKCGVEGIPSVFWDTREAELAVHMFEFHLDSREGVEG